MTALLGTMIGSYRLVRLLGSGGMGDVYLGEHPQIRSRVAVKVLHAEHAQERTHVERFLNEARAVNTIRHDNIVKILDLGTLADGRPYLVMEYVDGLSLAHLLRLRGTLPLGGLLRAANDVLAGLAAAHRHLVIHRDLKPDNVYVSAAGRAFVLDFGLAKLVGEQGTIVLTRKGTWLGTPYYMAPEQIAGGKTDGRTDLYALGVILYQGVTGRLPFDAPEIDEIFRRHLTMTPPPPRALRPDLPAAVEALILRALEKDPARRCGSAKEMAALLAPARAALGAAAGSDNLADLVGATAFPGAPGPAPAPAATPAPAARGVAYQSTTASAPAVAPAAGLAYQSTVASAPALAPAALPYQATVAGAPALAPPPGLPYQATVASAPALAPPYQATMASGAAAALPYQATVASAAAGPAPFVAPTDRGARPRARRGPLIAVIAGGAVALIAVAGVGGYLVARAGEDAAPTRAPAAGRPPRGTAAGAGKAPSSKEPIVTRRPGSIVIRPGDSELETLAAPPNPRDFDALGYLPRATALARQRMSDAVLVDFDVQPVGPDGRVDLTKPDGEVDYRFRSPGRSATGEKEPRCLVNVEVKATEVEVVSVRSFRGCKEPARPAWRCTLAGAARLAQSQGVPRRPAKVSWLQDGWFFSLDDPDVAETVKDRCR